MLLQVVQFIEHGSRLPRPEKCPEKVYGIMRRCWNADASSRPTFKELNQHFEEDPLYADVRDLVKQKY